MKIRKAVITAAGWGTRFLPVTRSQPKEMLPLLDKPLVQYSLEEAVNSGIEQVIIVTSPGKSAIVDYFSRSLALERFLEEKGEDAILQQMRKITEMVRIRYVVQKEQLGLGHAILTAKDAVGDEPFAVILPDDIIDGKVPGLQQVLAVYKKYGSSVVAVENVSQEETHKYGIIDSKQVEKNVYRILHLVEKPDPLLAPSRLGVIGRYVLTPAVFDILQRTLPGKNGEIQLTDALNSLLKQEQFFACRLKGTRYDAGTPLGWLKANVDLALKRKDIGAEFKEHLKELL